jgi:hypothetical protein
VAHKYAFEIRPLMISCYFSDVQDSDCSWKGDPASLALHLITHHEISSFSGCKHHRLILEMILEPDCYGYRFVVISFKGSEPRTMIFEEYYDEKSEILTLILRSIQTEKLRYSMRIQGNGCALEFEGTTQTFQDPTIDVNRKGLCIHFAQLQHLSEIRTGNELRYKILVTLYT